MSPADDSVRSLAGEARAARHAAVLDEASLEFNRAGVAGASLSVIARRVGLSRASLYNYAADREDLAHQCYLRACAVTQADLKRAAAGSGSGLDKTVTFLRLALDMDHAPMAVLSDLAFLPAARQAEVRAARSENAASLAAFLRQGVQDGSVRPLDVEVACQAIWGLLSWAPLSNVWSGNSDETFAIRTAAAIPGLVAEGVAAEGAAMPVGTPRLADVLAQVQGSAEGRDERLETLARAGSMLFNRRGIDGVSLDDVAAEVGATKGQIYHYFDSKTAFVTFCYERAFSLYERIMALSDRGATGLERTWIAIGLNTEAQLDDVHPLSLGAGYDAFREADRRRFTARTNALADKAVAHGRAGVLDGSLRPFDLEPVAMASAGTFSYLAKWLEPGRRAAADTADEVGRLFLLGLKAR